MNAPIYAPAGAIVVAPAPLAGAGGQTSLLDCTESTYHASPRPLPVREPVRRRSASARPKPRPHGPHAPTRLAARRPAAKQLAARTPVAKKPVQTAHAAPLKRKVLAHRSTPIRKRLPIASRPTQLAQADMPVLRRLTYASPICTTRLASLDLGDIPLVDAINAPTAPVISGVPDGPFRRITDGFAPRAPRVPALLPPPGFPGTYVPPLGGGGGFPGGPGGSNTPGNPGTPGNPDTPPIVIPVPEPSSWALMLGGFMLVGYALRRRRGSWATVKA
ncbi:PEPxxWA-CTERM sorting domain-containing protein [uncultured Sphingomonas sp.]|uniref:PEPxxWA-CTERM sorting domain-containing protein n=1 Tax=uncultured Sphingomonas sp. TaxID=158754 RepID=UPI0025CD22DD|nr:PEPxxWA-CTERM sorting domain-containing protein [uncultured Sphingomonas sp.]